MTITIYHNPLCSKSRQTLELLQDQGLEPQIVEYLKTPPDTAILERLLDMLGLEPRELMRKKEKAYQEHELANSELSRDALIAAMATPPEADRAPHRRHGR